MFIHRCVKGILSLRGSFNTWETNDSITQDHWCLLLVMEGNAIILYRPRANIFRERKLLTLRYNLRIRFLEFRILITFNALRYHFESRNELNESIEMSIKFDTLQHTFCMTLVLNIQVLLIWYVEIFKKNKCLINVYLCDVFCSMGFVTFPE